MGFGGHAEGFSDWLFAVEEAIRTLQPEDPRGVRSIFPGGKCSEVAGFKLGIRWPSSSEQLAGISRATVACLCRGGCGRVVSATIDSEASVGRCRHRRIHFGVHQLLFDGT